MNAGLAAAAGLVQIGIIKASPVPQFAKGTKRAPAGFKWVGEEGPELINDNGGYAIMTNKDSMDLLKKYDIPAIPQKPDYITSFSVPASVMEAGYNSNYSIDYDKFGKSVGKALQENPGFVVKLDKDGFSMNLISKGKKVTYLNNRY